MRVKMKRAVAFAIAATSVGACSLDLQNPNSPTESQVTTSVDGVIALATGLQGRFAVSYGNFAYMVCGRKIRVPHETQRTFHRAVDLRPDGTPVQQVAERDQAKPVLHCCRDWSGQQL